MNKVILIGGGSGAGKTTIAKLIQCKIDGVTILSLDNYCMSRTDLPLSERAKLNFDHPSSYNGKQAALDLAKLKNNQAVDIPIYDFSIHQAKEEKQHIIPNKYLIIDSIFALYYPELLSQADYKIYVDASKEIRLSRRTNRDLLERGRSKEQTLKQWNDTVSPMHDIYIEPTKNNADLVIDNNKQIDIKDINISKILKEIKAL